MVTVRAESFKKRCWQLGAGEAFGSRQMPNKVTDTREEKQHGIFKRGVNRED